MKRAFLFAAFFVLACGPALAQIQIAPGGGINITGSGTSAGVTQVNSGTGLTGGPITGTGTLAILNAYQLPQSCSSNQVPQWNGSAWVCATISGALPSGLAGQEGRYNASAAFAAQYPQVFHADAAHTTGGAGQDLVNFFTSCGVTSGFAYGCAADLANEGSAPDFDKNPFTSATPPGKPVVTLSLGAPTTTDNPVWVCAGCSYASNEEGEAELRGPTTGWGGNRNNTQQGVILKPSGNFLSSGSTDSPCSSCVNFSGQTITPIVDNGNCSGQTCPQTYCGISMTTSSSTERVCLIGSSTLFTSQLQYGDLIQLPQEAANHQVVCQIDKIIDDTHATCPQELSGNAPNGGLGAGTHFSVVPPLTMLCAGSTIGSGPVNQGCTIHDFTELHSASLGGTYDLVNMSGVEGTIVKNLHLDQFNGVGLDVEGSGSQSGRYENLMITPDFTSCTSATIAALFGGSAPQVIDGMVVANTPGCNYNGSTYTTRPIGIVADIINSRGRNWHVEHHDPAVWVGRGNQGCTSNPCPGFLYYQGVAAHDDIFSGIDISCVSTSGVTCVHGFKLDNGSGANPYNILIEGLSAASTNHQSYLFEDVANGNSLPTSSNVGIPLGIIDSSGFPFFFTKCTNWSNGWCEDNGNLQLYNSGSVIAGFTLAGNVTAQQLKLSANTFTSGAAGSTFIGTPNSGNFANRPAFIANAGSTLGIVGIATPGASGHCPQFASNGIDIIDSGTTNCGGGGSPAWSAITNASGNLSLANGTNTTTFAQTSNVPWLWNNTTTGTISTTNSTPILELASNYYTGAGSSQNLWSVTGALTAGANGISTLSINQSGSSGAANLTTNATITAPAITGFDSS